MKSSNFKYKITWNFPWTDNWQYSTFKIGNDNDLLTKVSIQLVINEEVDYWKWMLTKFQIFEKKKKKVMFWWRFLLFLN